jgi:hypothetical protein
MNNYLRLLLYLKTFEGDGNEHMVEHLFPENTITEIKNILQELSDEGLVKYLGREERYLSFTVEQNILTNKTKWTDGPLNDHILNSDPPPFKAKITFKGSKYLKEELQMQESGKYNISVNGEGAVNNFVIDSQNVSINNKTSFASRADHIIDLVKSDQSINEDIKAQVVNDVTIAKTQINQSGKISGDLMKRILEYGSNISSIGQLVLGLFSV